MYFIIIMVDWKYRTPCQRLHVPKDFTFTLGREEAMQRATLLFVLISLLPVSPLRVCVGHHCKSIAPDLSASLAQFSEWAFRKCSADQRVPDGLIRWRLLEADSGAELHALSELPSEPTTLFLQPLTTEQPDGPTVGVPRQFRRKNGAVQPQIQAGSSGTQCGQSELALLQLLSREGLVSSALVRPIGQILAAVMCELTGDNVGALEYLQHEIHAAGATAALYGHVLRARLLANIGQLDQALSALGLQTPNEPVAAARKIEARSAPLTEGVFYQFHHTLLPGMSKVQTGTLFPCCAVMLLLPGGSAIPKAYQAVPVGTSHQYASNAHQDDDESLGAMLAAS